jgi:Ca2+-binding RTX toxin-like protein
MPSLGRPTVPSRTGWRKRSQSSASRTRFRIAALLSALGALLALGGVLLGGAAAKQGCASSQTTSPDGTVVHGSACADEIVVTSPLVKKVYAGEGDDVVYADGEVEEIYGGEGNDVIYGDQPEAEAGPGIQYEPSEGIDYEPAPYSRTEGRARRGSLASASNKVECSTSPCYGGDGSQEMFGGPGDDAIFGQRGNDTLRGEAGQDSLYGGIGDDTILGGDGADRLLGGLGTDTLDGNDGTDHLRGDGTVDVLRDTGSTGVDTLSFSTAVSPGFRGSVPIAGFPPEGNGEERGVYLRLDGATAPCGTQSCNNDARYGGGGDQISVAGFERVIGSPFADYIVGSQDKDVIFGGGGSDVLIGNGGDDLLYGGGESDYMSGGDGTDVTFDSGNNNCDAVEYPNGCAGTSAEVHERDRSKITVGRMTTTQLLGGYHWESFYMVGSSGADNVSARVVEGQPSYRVYLVFTAEPGSAPFDTGPDAAPGASGCEPTPSEVRCRIGPTYSPLDSITLAGMAGDDRLAIAGKDTDWEVTVSPVLLGGEGNDVLLGSGETEDMLVDGDGPGNDVLQGFGFDDALLNNEGSDRLMGGNGSDLLLSATICDGDVLQGAESKKGDGDSVNNASWAQLPAGAVVADLQKKTAGGEYVEYFPTAATASTASASAKPNDKGNHGGYSGPACASGSLDHLQNIDDLEGSAQGDALYGNAKDNNLLGRNGEDFLFARGGDDRIAAKDGQHDEVGGGGGKDICEYDDKGIDTVKLCNP